MHGHSERQHRFSSQFGIYEHCVASSFDTTPPVSGLLCAASMWPYPSYWCSDGMKSRKSHSRCSRRTRRFVLLWLAYRNSTQAQSNQKCIGSFHIYAMQTARGVSTARNAVIRPKTTLSLPQDVQGRLWCFVRKGKYMYLYLSQIMIYNLSLFLL